MTDDPAVDPLHERASKAAAELLAVLRESTDADIDPLVACSLALDILRCSAELRLRAEQALGALLAAHPDAGGPPRTTRPAALGRALRDMSAIPRGDALWLVRLAALDVELIEQVADAYWSPETYPRPVSARSVVMGAAESGSAE